MGRVEHYAFELSSHLTDLRVCFATKMWTASVARELDAYRDCSNRVLAGDQVR